MSLTGQILVSVDKELLQCERWTNILNNILWIYEWMEKNDDLLLWYLENLLKNKIYDEIYNTLFECLRKITTYRL